ncbi:hypothetical protein AC1031_014660 [Aphanomyces cochlioides]|nr:hypothetical protein AC1031_014660 [Aphanomyces cochlioides]
MWQTDGVDGGKSSMDVLISWISNESNYVRWRGGDKHSGATKASLANEIVRLMIKNGINNRNAKDIIAKISSIESSYREAREWREHTGQGIDDEDSINKEIKRRCPYFFEMDDVMRDRASTQPLATSEQLDEDFAGQRDSENESDSKKTNSQNLKKKRMSIDSNTPVEKKRSAMQAKLDDWTEITRQSFNLRQDEIKQKKDEFRLECDIEEKRLEIELHREARLAEEAKLNKKILELKSAEAKWDFDQKKEIQSFEKRLKTVETRRKLKQDGWPEHEIDYVCPL